jgi:hypothetical protein
MKSNFVFYSTAAIFSLITYAIGGNISTGLTTNKVLKLCNEKPNECKFKYDILMYNETGKVPYKNTQVSTKIQPKK